MSKYEILKKLFIIFFILILYFNVVNTVRARFDELCTLMPEACAKMQEIKNLKRAITRENSTLQQLTDDDLDKNIALELDENFRTKVLYILKFIS